MRFLFLAVVFLAGCAENKTWQQACFPPLDARPSGLAGMGAEAPAPAYAPVLTTRDHDGRRLIYCDR